MIPNTGDSVRVNLLDHPLFVVDQPRGDHQAWSLPQVLANLLTSTDPIRSYPGLAAEQASHWHRFTVRCAAKALHTMSVRPDALVNGDVEALAKDIQGALSEAAGSDEAWTLWNTDFARPAFLQPPIPDGHGPEEVGYKQRPIADLTALIGSKEFERKSEAVRYMTALEVTYALIEFQSGVIFGGRGNYETQLTPSRSGKGSGVPFMSVRFPRRSGPTFRHDVTALLDRWDDIRDIHGLRGEVWAIWAMPWDAQTELPASRLDPAFIPMARLIRLERPRGNRFSGFFFKASKASRVADHTGGAMLGDPFTPSVPHPQKPGQHKVRGVMPWGFTYPEVADLLGLGERGTAPSPSVQHFFDRPDSEKEAEVELLFDGVAFEQGKTLGLFRRELPLPVSAGASLLFANQDPLRRVHRGMLEVIHQAKRFLRAASRIVLHGEPRPKRHDETVADEAPAMVDAFAEGDDAYFRFLFEAALLEAEGDEGWRMEWATRVAGWARESFEEALPRLPAPGAQRLAREMNARDYLEWKLRDLGGAQNGAAA